jgi:hypothetical protein
MRSRGLCSGGMRPLKLTVRPKVEHLIGVTAVVLLILGPIAFVQNRKAARAPSAPNATWLTVYNKRWPAIVVLGIAAFAFSYSATGHDGQRWRVYGFPFPAGAFDSHGADYVGLVTLPFALFNALIWTTLPDLCLFVWRHASARRNQTRRA